jgi:hypothetical protein
MKKTMLLALSAVPGILIVYALLTGMLMRRIKPLPIVAMPDELRTRKSARPEPVPA